MKDKMMEHKKRIQKNKIFSGMKRVFHVAEMILRTPLRLDKSLNEWKKSKIRKYATKMHKILYKCPCCHAEMRMNSWRKWLWCEACGSRWLFWKNRRIMPMSTKTAFHTRDEWKNWERECVREEIKNGNYYFTDTVSVKIQTAGGEHLDWGYGTLTHTPEYMLLECRYGNEDYTLIRTGRTLENLPFNLGKEGKADCVELSSASETFLCYLSRKDAAVKLALAVEESHRQIHQKN